MTAERSAPLAGPLPRLWISVAAAILAVHLVVPLASLPRLATLNYNEGWNAYHADAVFGNEPLYRPAESGFTNNYPPLSFLVIALAALPIGGDPILAGRLVSWAAFLAIALEAAFLARRWGGSWRFGCFGGLLVATVIAAAFGSYVGMNDPQLLAHALMGGGLVLLAGGLTPRRVAAAAASMLAAGLVKHNLLALPLAVTLWLAVRDRRALRTWLVASALLVLGALVLLWAIHGAPFFESLLRPRITTLRRAALLFSQELPALAAPLAVCVVGARLTWRDADARLLVLYAGLAIASGFVFGGGEGVVYNVFIDAAIALALLGLFAAPRLAARAESWAVAPALLLGAAIATPGMLLDLEPALDMVEKTEAATWQDVAYLEAKPAPVLCETLSLCFWAGQPPSVDLFNSHQAFQTGVADERELLDRIERSEFSVVQLTSISKDREDERMSASLSQALQTHYVVDRVSANGVYLRPRRGQGR